MPGDGTLGPVPVITQPGDLLRRGGLGVDLEEAIVLPRATGQEEPFRFHGKAPYPHSSKLRRSIVRCSTPMRTISERRSLWYGDGLGAVQRERSGSIPRQARLGTPSAALAGSGGPCGSGRCQAGGSVVMGESIHPRRRQWLVRKSREFAAPQHKTTATRLSARAEIGDFGRRCWS